MPAFVRVNPGDPMQAHQLNQVIDALTGAVGAGVPIAPTAVNDVTNYALTVQNDDATNSRALSVLRSDGTPLITANVNGVTLLLANASVPNAALGTDVERNQLQANGGFEIWQRGNGPFTASGAYGPDRWFVNLIGTDTMSVSRDTTNVDASSAAAAAAAFTLGTGAGGSNLQQKLEDNGQLKGRTLSFGVRVRTSTSGAVRIGIWDSVNSYRYSSFHSGGGTYETLTVTAPIAGSATATAIVIGFSASCTAYLDNAMLVVGSQAANYVPMHPADDLARCLRYYEILYPEITGAYASAGGQSLGYGTQYRAYKATAPTLTKVGTWTVSNCAQPIVGNRVNMEAYCFYLFATSSAAGVVATNASTANTSVIAEANP